MLLYFWIAVGLDRKMMQQWTSLYITYKKEGRKTTLILKRKEK